MSAEAHAEQARMRSEEAARSRCSDTNYLHLLAAPSKMRQRMKAASWDECRAVVVCVSSLCHMMERSHMLFMMKLWMTDREKPARCCDL